MSLVKNINIENLSNFCKDSSCLSIVERKKPENAQQFFEELLKNPFNLNKTIEKKTFLEEQLLLIIPLNPYEH